MRKWILRKENNEWWIRTPYGAGYVYLSWDAAAQYLRGDWIKRPKHS